MTIASTTASDFSYTPGALQPGHAVHFEAAAPAIEGRRFLWLFGDGARAIGRAVDHRFPDAEGTLRDRSGRFRVLLHIVDADGTQNWSSQSLVIADHALAPIAAATQPAESAANARDGRSFTRLVRVPADGGYTFTLLTSTTASLRIDDLPSANNPPLRPQVCGATGDVVQAIRVSVVLRAGLHRLQVERNDAIENAGNPKDKTPMLLWEGPGVARQTIPEATFTQ